MAIDIRDMVIIGGVGDGMLHAVDSTSLALKFSIRTGKVIYSHISLHVFNTDYLVIGSSYVDIQVYKVTNTKFEKIGESIVG